MLSPPRLLSLSSAKMAQSESFICMYFKGPGLVGQEPGGEGVLPYMSYIGMCPVKDSMTAILFVNFQKP